MTLKRKDMNYWTIKIINLIEIMSNSTFKFLIWTLNYKISLTTISIDLKILNIH